MTLLGERHARGRRLHRDQLTLARQQHLPEQARYRVSGPIDHAAAPVRAK